MFRPAASQQLVEPVQLLERAGGRVRVELGEPRVLAAARPGVRAAAAPRGAAVVLGGHRLRPAEAGAVGEGRSLEARVLA